MKNDELERLQKLFSLSIEFAEIKDLDFLMERILRTARDLLNCDAGSIYIKEGDHLEFSYTQNDTLQKRLAPGQKLIYNAFTVPINNKSISGYVAGTGEILNIPDAYNLSDSLSYGFDRSIDESTEYRTLSILTIPLKKNNNQIIGVLQLINAMDEKSNVIAFDPDMEQCAIYLANFAAGALERAQLMRAILLRMIRMAELRDPAETGNHVNRVAGFAVEIYENWARKKGIAQEEIDRKRDVLRMAAMLHDVGKVAISDVILKKPGRLTPEEFDAMKEHTIFGACLFRDASSELEEASREVALNHHEWFNGTGYPGHIEPITEEPIPGKIDDKGKPLKKKGEEIPLFGRIVAIADVYDALSTKRCYKEAWEEDRVLETIRSESESHFDPELIDAFFSCLPTLRSIYRRYS